MNCWELKDGFNKLSLNIKKSTDFYWLSILSTNADI